MFICHNGDFTKPQRQRKQKRHLKIQVRVTCTTSRLFQFVQLIYNVAELSSNRTGGNGLQVSTENENLLSCAHALHKTLNLSISRCCLAEDGDETYQNL